MIFVVVTICVPCQDGNKGFTDLLVLQFIVQQDSDEHINKFVLAKFGFNTSRYDCCFA